MHEAALAQAALPAPAVVLGLALRPYSIGHELFLVREGNPLALAGGDRSVGGGDIRPQDLSEAALICCGSWTETKRLHADLFIGAKLWLWHRRPSVRRGLRQNFQRELRAFLEYREGGNLEFRRTDIAKPGRTYARIPGAPFLLQIQQFLMLRFGLTEDAAWDYPLGLAKMRYQTFLEDGERYEIYNEHEAEFDRFVAEQEALLAKGDNHA